MVERILHPHTWLLHTGGCVYLFINIAAEWGSSCLQARLDTTKSKKHNPWTCVLNLDPAPPKIQRFISNLNLLKQRVSVCFCEIFNLCEITPGDPRPVDHWQPVLPASWCYGCFVLSEGQECCLCCGFSSPASLPLEGGDMAIVHGDGNAHMCYSQMFRYMYTFLKSNKI